MPCLIKEGFSQMNSGMSIYPKNGHGVYYLRELSDILSYQCMSKINPYAMFKTTVKRLHILLLIVEGCFEGGIMHWD